MMDPKESIKLLTDIEQNTADTAKAVGVTPAGAAGPPPIRATVVTQAGDTVASPTSTEEEDRATHGQRAVNMVWETTQRQIALAVIIASLAVAGWLAVTGKTDASTFLYGVANLVIGFYFGRTNHTRIGGVPLGR